MAKSKKDIDKELMYKKIMPSATRSAAPVDDDDDDEPRGASQAEAKAAAAQSGGRFAGAQLDKIAANVRKKVAKLAEEPPLEPLAPRRRATPEPDAPEAEPPAPARRRPAPEQEAELDSPVRAPARKAVSSIILPGLSQREEADEAIPTPEELFAPKEAALINLMEHLVEQRIGEVISKFRCCQCDKCHKDIIAIALNKLKPHYVVLDDLNAPFVADRQTTAEVTTALIQAVLVVKAHPRH